MLKHPYLIKFIEGYPLRKFKKGNIILYQGEVSRNTFFVKSGVVKVYAINGQGDERIVVFYTPSDIFPSPSVRGSNITAPYYFETVTETEIYVIPHEEFAGFVNQDKDLLRLVANYYITKYSSAVMRISALEQAKASEKLAYTLFYLMQAHGREISSDLYRIDLSLTQQMLASLIGLTRETTANELLKLKRQGILSYTSQRYIIHRDKLLQLLGDDAFTDY